MPGAQPRRAPVARTLSAARRGSNVPAGVPGIYRVPRVRTVTAQASDPGRASAASGWIQPPDQEDTSGIANVFAQGRTVYGPEDPDFPSEDTTSMFKLSLASANPAVASGVIGGTHPGYQNWSVIAVVLDPTFISALQYSPSPPPGMSVEYEAPYGVLLTARLRGSVMNELVSGSTSPIAKVYEIPESQLDPGADADNPGTQIGPSLWTPQGAEVFSTATVDVDVDGLGPDTYSVQEFTTDYQDFPESSQRIGWRVGSTHGLTQAAMASNEALQTYLYGVANDPDTPRQGDTGSLLTDYTWRPPRYRFV